jgi:hypothetical protein
MRTRVCKVLTAVTASLAAAWMPTTTAGAAAGAHGYDVSYPQCSIVSSLPPHDAFAIIGVNDGIVYTPNPCLASEYSWATSGTPAAVSFYANTANPGPTSSHWPKGQTANGITCPNQSSYRIGTKAYNDCSYIYGWNAAANSLAGAVQAVGTPAPAAGWWLDIESANSWTTSRTANIFDIRGGLTYLKKNTRTGTGSYVGIYTNSSSWSSITGSTQVFSKYPFWYPGATAATAPGLCSATSVTGGHIRYTQYDSNNLDNDYDCG